MRRGATAAVVVTVVVAWFRLRRARKGFAAGLFNAFAAGNTFLVKNYLELV